MRVIVFMALLTLGVVACAAQDNILPQPSGDFAVGTTHLVFVDHARPEVFTDEPDDNREVTVRAWYPALAGEDTAVAPYYEDPAAIVSRFGYPTSLQDIYTNSRTNARVSAKMKEYPVVLFNHGWGEHAAQNTVLMEHLASHGYIVFSIAHHYEAKYWAYPDGSLGYLSLASSRFQQIMQEQGGAQTMGLFEAMFTTRGSAAQDSLFKRTVEAMPVFLGESPRIWARDIAFIIDELDSLNSLEGRFGGKLDLDRLAVVGMSLGGAAAGQACLEDDRIVAAMNIDGGLLGDLPYSVVSQPMFYMVSRRFIGYDDVFAEHAAGDVYTLTIAEADHYDFSDFTLLHRRHPMIGNVDGRQMLNIINDYTLAFLDLYLKGEESGLIGGDERPYPEVDFRINRRP